MEIRGPGADTASGENQTMSIDVQAAEIMQDDVPAAAKLRAGMLSYKPVGAILAGLSVLRYMANASSPLPLSRITRDLGLNPSTCLNILRTLTDENYVMFDPQSKLYSMGLGVLELVSGAMAQGRDLRAIRALTDQISSNEIVTVTLWRRVQRDRIMLVLESLPEDNMSIKMTVGQRLPLLVGAAGRLMAAYSDLSEAELAQQFKQVRLERAQPFREFMLEVRTARERGFAVDEGHYTIGAASIAVPVLNENGQAVFALTATMFAAHFSMERAEVLAAELARPAALLASTLPYQ
jgi:DNA-binding IclR family transcriptional regulator